jgi:NADH dehydrogenase
MTYRLATVFGGSGFIGRHLVQRLAAQGWRVRVAVRDPAGAGYLQPLGDVGQIVPVFADVRREDTVRAAVGGAQLVVNLVGILFERGKTTFRAIHEEGAAGIAAACKAAEITCLVHVSALGASADSPSAYARSKAAGEAAVLGAVPTAAVLRPSVIFGPEDGFFNRFAALASCTPVLPVFGACGAAHSGGPRFQPVYVGDVADAIIAVAASPERSGHTYELGGPRTYTLKEVMQLMLEVTHRHRFLLRLPLLVARVEASFLQLMPNPLITPDQVKLLASDNVVSPDAPGFAQLGIIPEAAEVILPTYLNRFRPA